MPIILNIAGFMAVIAGAILSGMHAITDSSSISGVVAGIATFLMDLIYRTKLGGITWTKFIRPSGGCHVFFIPIWIWGIFIVIATLSDF